MNWADEIVEKEVKRQKAVQAIVAMIHREVDELLPDIDELGRLLALMNITTELIDSVMISVRADDSKKIIAAALGAMTHGSER